MTTIQLWQKKEGGLQDKSSKQSMESLQTLSSEFVFLLLFPSSSTINIIKDF